MLTVLETSPVLQLFLVLLLLFFILLLLPTMLRAILQHLLDCPRSPQRIAPIGT